MVERLYNITGVLCWGRLIAHAAYIARCARFESWLYWHRLALLLKPRQAMPPLRCGLCYAMFCVWVVEGSAAIRRLSSVEKGRWIVEVATLQNKDHENKATTKERQRSEKCTWFIYFSFVRQLGIRNREGKEIIHFTNGQCFPTEVNLIEFQLPSHLSARAITGQRRLPAAALCYRCNS